MSPVKVPWELAEFLRVPFWQVTCVEHSDNKMANFYAFPPALRKQVLRSRTTWPPDHPALGISQRITRTEGAEDWQHFPTEPPNESDEEPDSKTRADASGDEPKCYERSRSPNKRFPMHPRHLLEWEETRFRLFFLPCQSFKKSYIKKGTSGCKFTGFESTLDLQNQLRQRERRLKEMERELRRRGSQATLPGEAWWFFNNDLPAGREKATMALVDVKQEHTGEQGWAKSVSATWLSVCFSVKAGLHFRFAWFFSVSCCAYNSFLSTQRLYNLQPLQKQLMLSWWPSIL